jgi:hypothetical protein
METISSMCEINLVEHDDVMIRLLLQTLIEQSHEWYMSLLVNSISIFDYLEGMFITMYDPPKSYHTLLTKLTQIHLKNG